MVAAVLDAWSEKAAAHRLGPSHSTVKHHLANARSKVGANTTTYGLGALPDPLDERGHPISALYASEGLTASMVLPASYAAPAMPPMQPRPTTETLSPCPRVRVCMFTPRGSAD